MSIRNVIRYALAKSRTEAAIGYFGVVLQDDMPFKELGELLAARPMDGFLHNHVLAKVRALPESIARDQMERFAGNPAMLSVFAEAGLEPDIDPAELAAHSPNIDLAARALPDHAAHKAWSRALRDNQRAHAAMDLDGLPELDLPAPESPGVSWLKQARTAWKAPQETQPEPALEATIDRAEAALAAAGASAGPEQRHQASLSPVGLLREWDLRLSVLSGELDYTLSGSQTSWGRGLTLEAARASYMMEMVERVSAFASFGPRRALDYANGHKLRRARLSELLDKGLAALDPNTLRLETPYRDQALYWLQAAAVTGPGADAYDPVWLPAQCVFLFCNLNEPSLFSGLGSTGLATGNTMAQARVAALCECLERDAEAVWPYHPSRCFTLRAEDPEVAGLLAAYQEQGVALGFQDLTTEYGLPVYRAFAVGPDGTVAKGAGASLSGRRAVLSAMTETPFAYPEGPASQALPEGLPVRALEELPELSTGSHEGDAALLEGALLASGARPLYVDLTREDMGVPVVRAVTPGLELLADYDEFSRISPRALRNCRALWGRASQGS